MYQKKVEWHNYCLATFLCCLILQVKLKQMGSQWFDVPLEASPVLSLIAGKWNIKKKSK